MDESLKPLYSELKSVAGLVPKKQVLSVLDTVIALYVVTPLTIAHWRGTWELVERNRGSFPIWQVFLFASSMYLIFTVARQSFEDIAGCSGKNLPHKVILFLSRRLYTYAFACCSVLHWNSGFNILDTVFETFLGRMQDRPSEVAYFAIACHAMLLISRSYRNILTVPFVIALDTKSGTFNFPTRFNTKIEEKTTLYVLDCLFSVFIIGTLVVFVWRGAWVLVDIYLFPENEYWSAWGSLVLGYTIVAIAFLLQPMMRWICDRISGLLRLLVADVFLFFSFVGTVNVWRGIWNLLNLYFLPENMELSAWITHWVCLILLILLKCSNTLLVRGVYIDADEPAGKCVVFPVYYLRLIFQRERIKKINKKFQIEAMSRRKIELDNIKIDCSCGTDLKNHITKENAQNHSPSQ
ncbi:uncharacterized protein LOC116164911 isoform X2 [Photinus pyralis]|nr:uncharacterized protein LOC116164911 isoform X2 [Photinus pyralis]